MSEKLSREDVAKIEIGKTTISRPLAITAVAIFLAFIMVYPLFQAGYEMTNQSDRSLPQALDIYPELFKQGIVKNSDGDIIRQVIDTNAALLKTINDYEDNLEQQAVLQKYLLSPAQGFMVAALGTGNEKAFLGRDGWLFYKSGVRYLTNGGFLDPMILKKRSAKDGDIQPDPRLAILQFNQQLADRGIKLIIMPMPVKPMFYPEMFTGKQYQNLPLQNSSFKAFCQQLQQAGVALFDPSAVLLQQKQAGIELYLKSDTHWTPMAMETVAKSLSRFIQQQVKLTDDDSYKPVTVAKTISSEGDIATMLKIDNVEHFIPKQTVTVNEVIVDKSYWRLDKNAEVLLLGDSFSNIYSLPDMGWGAHAGFAEQLSRDLRRPVDAILRNDAGANATRKQLSQDLKRGYDRLAGKKVVVWEFAARELADGDWKLLDMKLGTPKESSFVVPVAGQPVEIEAVVMDISAVPRPGSVPYKDHVMSLHLTSQAGGKHYLVYTMSMKNNKLLPTADLRIGTTAKFKLYNWQDVETQYGGLNRSDLDDEDITLEDPCWGELLIKQ